MTPRNRAHPEGVRAMTPEATLEIVRALSEGRRTQSKSALYRLRPPDKKAVQFETRINQDWKTLVQKLIESGKIHVLAGHAQKRLENKRELLGY